MQKDQIKDFKFSKCLKMESPYQDDKLTVYHLFVNVNDLPIGFPTDVNPRDVNPKKHVYKKIVSSLTGDNDSFHINNRGILISAKDIKIDSINKKISVNVGNGSESDNSEFGVLDGGHTYHAILNNRASIAKDSTQFVHLEIMTNVQAIDELASARNTSVQVSDKAIAELGDKFEFVKEAIKNEAFAANVSYRENEDKELDTVDFVRLMFAFNVFKYTASSNLQPIPAYSGKAQVLKDYLSEYDTTKEDNNPYRKISLLLPEITQLYDLIELEMVEGYRQQHPGGKFGSAKGVEYKEKGPFFKTKYYKNTTKYQISQGLLFPIVAAFRALVKEDKDGRLSWEIDPIDVWNEIKSKLVNNTIEMSRSLGNNPQSAGKSSTLWSQNYDAVNSAKLQIMLNKLQKK